MQIYHLPQSLVKVGPSNHALKLLSPRASVRYGMCRHRSPDWRYYAMDGVALQGGGNVIFPHFSVKSGSRYYSKKQGCWVDSPGKIKVSTVHLTPKAGGRGGNPHLWWDGESDEGVVDFYKFAEDITYRRSVTNPEHTANMDFFVAFLNMLRLACSADKKARL